MDIFKDINELKTITGYLNAAYIKRIGHGFTCDGWSVEIEYASEDDLVIVGRAATNSKGSTLHDHLHEHEVNTITLIKGSVEIIFDKAEVENKVLDKFLDSIIIPPNKLHKIVSLEDNTEIVFSTIPADPGYAIIGKD